ncbi:hypothetical protein BH09MYX1_BH09MYX1_52130 [soil metagenome]
MSSVKGNGLELDVTIFWSKSGERSALAQKNLPLEGDLLIGEDSACHLTVPSTALCGATSHPLLSTVNGVTTVTPPAGATVFVNRMLHAGASFTLTPGMSADVTIGDFVVALSISAAEAKPAHDVGRVLRRSAIGTILGSAFVHASIFASLALFMPSLSEASIEDVNRDQLETMKHYLTSSAAAEAETKPETAANDSATGAQTLPSTTDKGGTTGTETPKDQGHWAAQGTASKEDASLARDHALAEASDFGMLRLLDSTTDTKAPVVPWGTVMLGADRESHLGNLWGGDMGDMFGTTVALSDGPRCTGARCSHGVDVKDVGVLTAKTVAQCSGDHCDAGGVDHGRPQRGHETKTPGWRPDPNFTTNGHLDAEVIRRAVRLNEGKMLSCYADGIRKNPGLEGRVEVRFVIGRDGSVTVAQDGAGSDLPDSAVRACVVQSFYSIGFSAPKDGTVRVTYPFTFSPQ